MSKVFAKAKEIAIRIGDNELAIAALYSTLPIPAFLYIQNNIQLVIAHARMKFVKVRDEDLQVQPSAERDLQRGGPESPTWAVRLLEHQMRASQRDISKRFLWPLKKQFEAEYAPVKAQGGRQVATSSSGVRAGVLIILTA